jgi:hypothetical protein
MKIDPELTFGSGNRAPTYREKQLDSFLYRKVVCSVGSIHNLFEKVRE